MEAGEVATDVMVSWDGLSLACRDGNQQMMDAVAEEGESLLPELPEGISEIKRIYWPMEHLLVRTFSLPLSEPRLLDAAIMSQELSELSGEDDDEWWLAWHAGKTDEGIAGLVFGLPQSVRQAMAEHPVWQSCPQLLVDGWERLTSFRGDFETCAVVDEDDDGVFIGFVKQGAWRGMRRINRKLSDNGCLGDEAIAQQIGYSWQAMGMDASDPVVGRAGARLGELLLPEYEQWQVEVQDEQVSRHYANFAADNDLPGSLNFRHGKWAAQKSWYEFRPWRRPLAMAAVLLLIWMGVTITSIYSLDSEAEGYRQSIESAFHRGLPNEAVMLDPLAQLKKAAGGPALSLDSRQFLDQLQLVSQLYQDISWEMSELEFRGGEMRMSGAAKDIDSLNKMRDQLQQKSGREVVISDTDLSGGKVTFRMKW